VLSTENKNLISTQRMVTRFWV